MLIHVSPYRLYPSLANLSVASRPAPRVTSLPGRRSCLVASPARRQGGDMSHTVAPLGTVRTHAKVERMDDMRAIPLTRRVIDRAVDARFLLVELIDRNGERDQVENETLLLFDALLFEAERADLARRKADTVRDTGEDVSPWFNRLERELRENYAHVAHLQHAA